ncbi:MAG: hypothetical protein WCA35_09900 [Kovacikia sp.]
MYESLELGQTPCNEECAQVGKDNYPEQSRKECRVWISQLQREFPKADDIDAHFKISQFTHDLGTYREVVLNYNLNDDRAVKYASQIEQKCPQNWDAKARQDLGLDP